MSTGTQVALVTGVGRAGGLGYELCRQLSQRGLRVFLTARHLDTAEALAMRLRGLPGESTPLELDISLPSSVAGAVARVGKQTGRLDILINNAAGLAPAGELPSNADLTLSRTVFDSTLFGTWRVIQAFLPLLRCSKHARVVNVSSGAGSHGDPQFGMSSTNAMGPSYAVSKAGLNALTALFARELKSDGILVNAVCPGLTATFPGAEQMGARSLAEGAASILWAAFIDDQGPTGGFFRDGKPLPW